MQCFSQVKATEWSVHDPPGSYGSNPPRLLERVRLALRARHYSRRTEPAYVHWVRRFILIHGKRHPGEMGETEVNGFLTHLAVRGRVSASTQNQALSALLFLYRHVLEREIGDLGEIVRARRPRRLPVVLRREEVKAVLDHLSGDKRLVAALLYGTGLRLAECLALRVQDIDFGGHEILVRDGKGSKDRVTMLPQSLVSALRRHLDAVQLLHDRDLGDGWGRVQMPDALDRKYPGAARECAGSGSSRRRSDGATTRRVSRGAITRTSPSSRKPSSRPW
jgi:integron integrase